MYWEVWYMSMALTKYLLHTHEWHIIVINCSLENMYMAVLHVSLMDAQGALYKLNDPQNCDQSEIMFV